MENVGNRIAVMILGPLGDVINTSVVFKTLSKAYPDAELSIITSDRGAPATVGIPEISNVFVIEFSKLGYKKKFYSFKNAWSLRNKFDTVIVLDNSLRSALCAFLTLAKRRIGRGKELRELFLTDIVPYLPEEKQKKIHVSEHYARCLKPLGIYKENMETSFSFQQSDEDTVLDLLAQKGLTNKKLIGFCPACHLERKTLLIEDSIKIIKYLNSLKDYKVITVGGDDVKQYMEELGECKDIEFTDLSGMTTFAQTAALIDKCEKFISVDTSCMHLAFARKVPTFSIFFEALNIKWGPKDLEKNRCYTNLENKQINFEIFFDMLRTLGNKNP